MRFLVSIIMVFALIFCSCSDRDDNLEGLQIRVLNTTSTNFSAVVIDSLVFQDIQSNDITLYQKQNGFVLPDEAMLIIDSMSVTVPNDNIFEIDSTTLNLITYSIKGLTEDNMEANIELFKD